MPSARPSGTASNVISSTAARATLRCAGTARPRPGSAWLGPPNPRRALREQVLAAAHRTRQLPPLAGDGLDRASRGGRLVSAVFPAGRGRPGSAVFPASRDAAPDRRRPRVPRLLAAAVAACAAAGLALGVVSQVTAPPKTPAAISSVLGASDARSMTAATDAGGTVTAVVSWDKREAVVTTAGLASLPPLKVYQLWVMGPAGTTEARSAGLLSRTGHAGPVLAAALRPGDRLGITVEPAGGTAAPTTSPVVVMPLPV